MSEHLSAVTMYGGAGRLVDERRAQSGHLRTGSRVLTLLVRDHRRHRRLIMRPCGAGLRTRTHAWHRRRARSNTSPRSSSRSSVRRQSSLCFQASSEWRSCDGSKRRKCDLV